VNTWNMLSRTQQNILLVALNLLLALLLTWSVFNPVQTALNRLKTNVAQQQARLTWMQATANTLTTLKSGQAATNKPLLNAIEDTIKQQQLTQVQHIDSTEHTIQVRLAAIPAQNLFEWLFLLGEQCPYQLQEFDFRTTHTPGVIQAKLVFKH
jgi:type II secretory pathway component PulM